jgi:hypothetical protein
MSVTVLRKARTTPPEIMDPEVEPVDWVKVAACGSLICGGLLLLTGKKRAGLIAAASGTALAMLEHEDTIRQWWQAIPHYLGQAHSMIDRVQEMVDKAADKGQSLRRVLGR